MADLAVCILLTCCVSFGVYLRYAPFSGIVGPVQRRLLYLLYGAVALLNTLLLWAGMSRWGVSFAFNYLRFGGVFYAMVLTLINILVIRGKLREHLFIFGVVITCNYLLLSIPNYVITFLSQDGSFMCLFIVLGIYFGALLLTCWPLKELLCHTVSPFLEMETEGYFNTLWFVPIALFGANFLSLGGEHNTGGVMQLIRSLLYIAVIVFICLNITAGNKRLQRKQLMEKQLEGQKLHYTELKVCVEDARKLNHDLKHHITAIRGYLNANDTEGLDQYCNELIARIGSTSRVPYTGNVAVDGVIYHYMQQAMQENIDFRMTGIIRAPEIADVDLCALLGNALDNAIWACHTIESGRSISVIGQSEERLLSVVIQNSFDGVIKQNKKGILSRKRGNAPGLGLVSMHSICESYGGSMETKWDDSSFTVIFLLPLTE